MVVERVGSGGQREDQFGIDVEIRVSVGKKKANSAFGVGIGICVVAYKSVSGN